MCGYARVSGEAPELFRQHEDRGIKVVVLTEVDDRNPRVMAVKTEGELVREERGCGCRSTSARERLLGGNLANERCNSSTR